jgi:hypothetical protein
VKRIAAVAALTVTMLAVPAAAMASTGGSGAGPSQSVSGSGPIWCPALNLLHHRPFKFKIHASKIHASKIHANKIRINRPVKQQVRVHGRCSFSVKFRGFPPKFQGLPPFPGQPPFPFPGQPPFRQICRAPGFTFDIASGSSTFTEVSGPTLAPAEEFTYDGSTYTIWTVNPGADSFTASVNGMLFVNNGSSITDGTASVLCSS